MSDEKKPEVKIIHMKESKAEFAGFRPELSGEEGKKSLTDFNLMRPKTPPPPPPVETKEE